MFKKLIADSTAKSPWLFHINAGSCNGCDIEIVSVLTPRFDAERLGFKLTGSPRQADIAIVTGPVTKQSLPRVLRSISQIPEPRCIVTCGSCPQSGNVFKGSYAVAGPLSKYVHVDVDIAGCAPRPEVQAVSAGSTVCRSWWRASGRQICRIRSCTSTAPATM